jgi:urease accessory protein
MTDIKTYLEIQPSSISENHYSPFAPSYLFSSANPPECGKRGRGGAWGRYFKIEFHLFIFISVISIFAFYPSSAFAHIKGGEVIGIISGLQHPISGLDHVLAMIAVGLWGAQLGAPAVWLLPVTFPMVMAFGGLLGLMGVNLPGIEIGIAVSAIFLGFAVFREARLKLGLAAVLVGFFAIFHGYAHGAELPPGGNGLLYSIGFVVMTGCLHATGIALGLVHQWSAGRAALRAAGACVSLAGVFFLWRALV